ncbi:MAG: serine/threonine-protein kinase [Polyangiaceae bacterium]
MTEPTKREVLASEPEDGVEGPPPPVELDDATPLSALSGRYQPGQPLGAGGMGTVLACRDLQIGRDIALKRLDAGDDRARARFVREARLQGQLEHPAVPPVYELGIDDAGRPAFAMKRIRGITLRRVLSQLKWYPERYAEAYSQRRLLSAFSRVCLALDYAHQRGVLHRDLKPGNLMWGEFGEITVIDWGLARLMHTGEAETVGSGSSLADQESVTPVDEVLGTPGYAAPEQLEDPQSALSAAADVYSLGAILFEMLTGQPLHEGSAKQAIASTLVEEAHSPRRRCPDLDIAPELDALCVAATQRRASNRLQSARELYEGIERFLDGQRDREARHELATKHVTRATALVEKATADGDLDARREALRELGRALAVDPGSTAALTELSRLMLVPLSAVPSEVEEAMASTRIQRVQRGGRGAAVAYLTLFLYLPLVLWSGVRDWAPILALYGLNVLSALGVWLVSRSRTAPPVAVMACVLVSTLSFAFTSSLFGALVLMPAMIAVNTTAFGLVLDRTTKYWAIAIGVAAVLLPAALEFLGLTAVRYTFDSAGMHIAPGAIDLTRTPSYVLLLVASFASVITGALATSSLRESLDQAELRLQLGAWQLREFSLPRR